MITRGAFGNLVNRYKAVLKKCRLINTFGSLAVASMLILGAAASAEAKVDDRPFWALSSTETASGDVITYNGDAARIVYAQGAVQSSGNNVGTYIFTGNSISLKTIADYPTLYDEGGKLIRSGNVVGIQASSFDSGLIPQVTIGSIDKRAQSVTIDVTNTGNEGFASGIWAYGNGNNDGGQINIFADTLSVKAYSEKDATYGIYAQNCTTTSNGNLATININAGKTYVDVSAGNPENAVALIAMSQGRMNIEGDLYVNTRGGTGEAIVARGDALININQGGTGTVQMNGDIDFSYDGPTSGTGVDAQVNVNLATADSYWNGNTIISWHYTNALNSPREEELKVSGLTVNLANGAVWTPTRVSSVDDPTVDQVGSAYVGLNKLNLDKGVINLNPDVDVEVDEMTGSGTVNLAADIKEGEHVGTLTAGTAKDAALDVNITGVTSDDITAEQAKKIMSNVGSEDEELKLTGNVAEGLVNGALNIGSDGSVSMGRNHVMESALEIASITSVSLDRILNNDVRKRMGDLRSVSGDSGVWMRWDGGRLKGDSGLTNDFNTVQIGADTLTGWDSVRVGLAASFTYGDGDHKRGSSEMEGVALAAYGVWMADNGMFADVIARLGNFDTDVKLAGYKGSINSTVASLSGEFGWRFNLDRFYVEPQLELAYTYVDGDKFSLGSARYDVDDTDSLIGRAGVSAGWKLPGDRGDIYARASVVQQFLGDAKISGANNGMLNVYELDGQDTWFEYGVGTNLRLTEKASVWADVERTEGAKIDEEWRGTVGLRYMF